VTLLEVKAEFPPANTSSAKADHFASTTTKMIHVKHIPAVNRSTVRLE
jgi:hypothetical protein